RFTGLLEKNGSTTIANYALTLNKNGTPTALSGPAGTINYTNDLLNRVTQACAPSCTGGSAAGVSWAYDAAGNIATKTTYSGSTTTATAYKYNADNELCW